ncbi:MAG: hypothetical protein GY835_18435 [bacterium]|nr:hypothetical protein [bacterium]
MSENRLFQTFETDSRAGSSHRRARARGNRRSVDGPGVDHRTVVQAIGADCHAGEPSKIRTIARDRGSHHHPGGPPFMVPDASQLK